MSISTKRSVVDEAAMGELKAAFRGELVRPTDASYDDHRKIWNGAVDRRPALIARCAGVADVMAAVRFARRTGWIVAVRSGGHSWPGLSLCDGGVVIDLSLMKGIRVDPQAEAFGLAVPAGIVTHTGLPGLTLAAASGISCGSTA